MERISSRQNPIVKRFKDAARSGRRDGLMLLDGAHLVEEALCARVRLEIVAIAEALMTPESEALLRRASKTGARLLSVSVPVLGAMSPVKQPTGVVAIAERPASNLAEVLERIPQLILLLAHVQDPGNVGAIVRAAEACGATALLTTRGTADPFGWKALRGGMGSTFRVPIAEVDSIATATRAASSAGLRVHAAVPREGRPISAVDFRAPTLILMGGEGMGLAPAEIAAADERVTIPMRPPVESLNVATAAALILYEASRQRAEPHCDAGSRADS